MGDRTGRDRDETGGQDKCRRETGGQGTRKGERRGGEKAKAWRETVRKNARSWHRGPASESGSEAPQPPTPTTVGAEVQGLPAAPLCGAEPRELAAGGAVVSSEAGLPGSRALGYSGLGCR